MGTHKAIRPSAASSRADDIGHSVRSFRTAIRVAYVPLIH